MSPATGYGFYGAGVPNLEELVHSSQLAFDVEATGLHRKQDTPLGVSAAYNVHQGYYFPASELRLISQLAPTFKVAHNAKYDILMLKKLGVELDKVYDTMIAAHLLEKFSLALEDLATGFLGMSIDTYTSIGKTFSGMSLDDMARFSGAHSIITLLLWQKFEPELTKLGLHKLYTTVEQPLIPVLADMELNGVQIDPHTLIAIGEEFERKLEALEEALSSYAGKALNFNSTDQVSWFLFTHLGLPVGKLTDKSKKPSTDAEVLSGLVGSHPAVSLLLKYRQYQKLLSTYVFTVLDSSVGNRIYGSFSQTGTRTGRLSSNSPNLQNIPKRSLEGRRIRLAFTAPSGSILVKVDYDQLELKMMAHYSQDAGLLNAFNTGKDIHEETAIRGFGDKTRRFEGKTLNYQVIYGGASKQDRQRFFEAYPGVLIWTTKAIRQIQEAGYARTLNGRIRSFPEYWSHELRSSPEHTNREAISTIIQGSSAEVVKICMRRIWEKIKNTAIKMVLAVHDEGVFEVPVALLGEFIPIVKQEMTYNELSIPLTVSVSVGKSWGSMKAV